MNKVQEPEECIELTDEQLDSITGGASAIGNVGGITCPLCGGRATPTRLYDPKGTVYRCSNCKHEFVPPKISGFF